MRTFAAVAAALTLGLSAGVVHAQTASEPAPAEPAADGAVAPAGDDTSGLPESDAGSPEETAGAPAEAPEPEEARADKQRGDKGKGGKDRRKRRKTIRLLRADANPSKAWFKGRAATFRYAFDGRRRRNVVVQVKRKGPDPKIVRRFERKDVRPRRTHTIDWDGKVDGGKKYARQGSYKFKVRAKRGGAAEARSAAGKPRTGFYKHKFPVRGRHSYGDGLGAGRGHRGADVFARCGTKLQAARAGGVQYNAYQGSGAGHYLVIDGKRNGKDYVYMHLRRASRHDAGERVRTGETIGRVGATGNATGCHLHFELWSAPGWYEGGDFTDAMAKLRAWDRFS